MKRNLFYRILILLITFACSISLSGCFGVGDDDDATAYFGIERVKTLYRKSDYDFVGAVGENGDKNYFNVYAYHLLEHLYSIYGNYSVSATKKQESLADTSYTENYYMYDSIRYSVTSNTTNGAVASTGYAWNFRIEWNASEYQSYFGSYNALQIDQSNFNSSYVIRYYDSLDYLSVFAGEINEDGYFEGALVESLEYSIYKIVLGYSLSEIASEISFTFNNGLPSATITGKTVGEALSDIKEQYDISATYVGLTESDQEKISEFILNYVIGEKALSVSYYNSNGVSVNRDYEKVVPKIVQLVCELASIGEEESDSLWLYNPYIASYTKDYLGDSMSITLLDNDAFSYIEAHEYQSAIISACEQEQRDLKELRLAFQYKNYNNVTNFLSSLRMTVRLLYHANGEVSQLAEKEITIDAGDYQIMDGGGEICFVRSDVASGEYGSYYNSEDVVKFDNNVQINTLSAEEDFLAQEERQVTGITSLRKYYNMVKSVYGSNYYGVSNSEQIQTSYLEVVFDIDKSAGRDYCYDFQFGMLFIND